MATTPSPRGDRPARSAKQVQLAPGYVDSSTLLFDSDDEGTNDSESEGEHDSEAEGDNESDDEVRHIAKKPRLGGESETQAKKEVPPALDTSCLAYYPETHVAVQRWNRMLGLPPPHPMSDGPSKQIPTREVDAHEPHVTKTLLPHGVINKNASYDETKAGFERLPGEIRSRCFPLDILPCCVLPQILPLAVHGQVQGSRFSTKSVFDCQSRFSCPTSYQGVMLTPRCQSR